MIPKKIHYCWFGGNPKSKLIEYCISSWKEYLPDYQIIEWNEKSFDTNINPFVQKAYENKKWAFVSDYVRAYALYEFGGIYLDTDVQIKKNLDIFLKHKAFSGFESKGAPFTALWATEKSHPWAKLVLEYYYNQEFSEKTNTEIVSTLLKDHFFVDPMKDEIQHLKEGITIYPSSHFCVDIPVNYAVHHFEGSWTDNNHTPFKDRLDSIYHINQFLKKEGLNNLFETIDIRNNKSNQKIILHNIRTKDLLKYTLKRILKLK